MPFGPKITDLDASALADGSIFTVSGGSLVPTDPATIKTIVTRWTSKGLTTLSNSTTRTSIMPITGSGSRTIPANVLQSGSIITVQSQMNYTTMPITATTITLYLSLGGVDVGSLTTTTFPLGASGPGSFNCDIAISDGGAAMVQGLMTYQTVAGGCSFAWFSTVGTPVIDVTKALTLDVQAQWSTANVANTISTKSCWLAVRRAS